MTEGSEMTSSAPASFHHGPVSAATRRLLALSWLIVAVCFASVAWTSRGVAPAVPIRGRVNPNLAPWWELTVLPEIGPSLARRIVDYRELQRTKNGATPQEMVFQSARDLDAVAGIGPKTIARLTSHLRFDAEETLSASPAAVDQDRQSQKEQN